MTAAATRSRVAAAKTMDDLAGRGIHLRLRNGIVPWTVADELPTIAEQRAVHQLAKALKTIIEKSSGA